MKIKKLRKKYNTNRMNRSDFNDSFGSKLERYDQTKKKTVIYFVFNSYKKIPQYVRTIHIFKCIRNVKKYHTSLTYTDTPYILMKTYVSSVNGYIDFRKYEFSM